MSARLSLSIASLFLAAASPASAATFSVTYDFTGGLGTPVVTGPGALGIDAGDFQAIGEAAISATGEDAIINSDDTGINETAALNDTDYFTFTIQRSLFAGSNINFESFTLDQTAQRGSQFDEDLFSRLVIQSSVTGFGPGNGTVSMIDNQVWVQGSGGDPANSVTENQTVNGIASAAYDDASTMTFQIRVHDTRTDSSIRTRLDNLVITGDVDVVAIPEPASIALLSCGLGLLLGRHRRE